MTGPILAIDQGTTNTKVLLVDGEGRIVRRASRPMQLSYPHAGWVEQDADALWESVREAADECLASADAIRPSGIAITNQRESVVVWERATGRPAGPATASAELAWSPPTSLRGNATLYRRRVRWLR